jgi:hypothetical protein
MNTRSRWLGTEYETAESQSYVGLSLEEALEAVRASGVKTYRVIDDLHNAISFDLRRDRLNLLVADGIVSRAAFF